jgi:hypothetical protein
MTEHNIKSVRETPHTRMLTLSVWSPIRDRDILIRSPIESIANQAEHLSKLDPKCVVKIMQDNVCRVKFVDGRIVNIVRMEYCSNEKSIDIPYKDTFL